MKKKYIKVLDHKELVRDVNSQAIINIDNIAMNEYKKEREFRLKLRRVVNDYDRMKKDIEELKILIKKLQDKNDNTNNYSS